MRDLSGKSLKELERHTHTSDSSLSRYFSGRLLPPWPVVAALCKVVRRDPREVLPMWEAARNRASGKTGRSDLPRDVADFTGREAELAELAELLETPSPAITVIDGMAGVGKTALAVHAAHRLAAQYPDGQLYIDLHGYTPGHDPLEPGTALRMMLTALGLPSSAIPQTLEERAGLWRAELTARRAIVVLDNAADEAQVRTLLPGRTSSLFLVTSRRRLAGLDGVPPLSLDLPPDSEARELFTRIAGAARCSAEPEAVSEVLARCGYLPLAVRLAATRLRHRPTWRVADLAEQLGEQQAGLGGTFELSLTQFSPAQRRVFRLLGLIRAGDFDAYAAAAVAGCPLAEVRDLLEELVDAHLLQQPRAGRYQFHDLLRQHARQTVPAEDRPESLTRMYDYYLHCAMTAANVLGIVGRAGEPGLRVPAYTPDLSTPAGVTGWFDAELGGLAELIRSAGEEGRDAHAWQLARALTRHFFIRTNNREWVTIGQLGLAAARRAGDTEAAAGLLGGLGYAYAELGQHTEARQHAEAALALATEDVARADLYCLLGALLARLGQFGPAEAKFREGLRLHRSMSAREPRTVWCEISLGRLLTTTGAWDEARAILQMALQSTREHRDPFAETMCLNALGELYLALGLLAEARHQFGSALTLSRTVSHRTEEPVAVNGLANVARRTGSAAEAIDLHEQAMELVHLCGSERRKATIMNDYAESCLAAGRPEEAVVVHREALDLSRRRNDQYEEARSLVRLGSATGDQPLADEGTRLFTLLGVPAG